VTAARRLMDIGALSLSRHGNISARVPGFDMILMTGSSLAGVTDESLAVLDLGGRVISGEVAPTEQEIISMHTEFYHQRPEIGCVIHTHSPHATAFAVAGEPLPCAAETMARWGIFDAVPVAGWAPRGSTEAISNIVAALQGSPGAEAVLLESHGVLVGGANPEEATRRAVALEETAQVTLLARLIGTPRVLTPEEARAAALRREEFLGLS
jgi:L-ribulose-5-phosphate 4-epimerase